MIKIPRVSSRNPPPPISMFPEAKAVEKIYFLTVRDVYTISFCFLSIEQRKRVVALSDLSLLCRGIVDFWHGQTVIDTLNEHFDDV